MTALPDELERLGQALALADGFQLIVLECDGLDSWDLHRLFDVVTDRVAELRGIPPLVLIYDPYLTTDETGSLRDEAWVEGVLQPIGELPRPTAEGASLVAVLDGTRFATTEHDELPSWRHLFQRMNEQRNALSRTFAGTLALALPPDLVRVFLDEAPDSASIRSGHFQLDPSILRPTRGPRRPLDLSAYPSAVREAAALRRRTAERTESLLPAAHSERAAERLAAPPSPPAQPPPADPARAHPALERLLLSLFSADELRRHLRYLPEGDRLSSQLPGATASPAMLAHEAVRTLEQFGLLADAAFWDRLLAERPRRRPDIDNVRALFPRALPSAWPPQASTARTDEWRVVLAALGLEAEPRLERLYHALSRASERGRAPFHAQLVDTVDLGELREVIVRSAPNVLILRAEHLVDLSSYPYLAQIFQSLRDPPLCVVFIAPKARWLARRVSPEVEHAVALDTWELDEPFIDAFLTTFMTSLARGSPIRRAFELAADTTKQRSPVHAGDDPPTAYLTSRHRPDLER